MSTLGRMLRRDLRSLSGQIVAISLVVIAGTAMLVMSLSNLVTLTGSRDRFYAEHGFADVFASVKRAPLPLLDAVRSIDGVRLADGRVAGIARWQLDGFDEPVSALLMSLPDPAAPLNRLFLHAGRLPDPLRPDELVVGDAFADAHGLEVGDEVRAVLNGRRQTLRIVGIGTSPETIYQVRPGDLLPDFERFAVAWMSREPLATVFDLDGAFNDVALGLEADADPAAVIDALDRLLLRYGGAGAYGRDLQMSHRLLDEELVQLRAMSLLFGAVFAAVAAFLLNIVIGRLVGLQREQIAVLRAFGYPRARVAAHYAAMVLAILAIGTLPGVALGAWGGRSMALLYADYYRLPLLAWRLPAEVLLLVIAFALAIGVGGTAAALRRVFRLQPAVAMRPEPPALFRRSLLERLGGRAPRLALLFDPTARMLLRTFERQPWRTALSVLGIGMACGMVVMTSFQQRAIERMITTQFGLAQRDDLMVALTEPSAARTVDELRGLPGIRAVEPFRSAAVVLRHGHRNYRTALQGLQRDGDLRRVLDRERRTVVLPAHGLLLTDHLARMLELAAGDRVELEFIEGRRRRVEAVVAGTVSEYLGVGAYASREYLNRLLAEGDQVTGAFLAVDRAARAAVLAGLHGRPRIAVISDRSAMIDSFRDTMAESILTFTVIAGLLAGSIAVGVVYNAARLTLSERSRELASLRVLGYTRREVRALVGGELLTLALLALLPGFAIGYGLAAWTVAAMASDLYRLPFELSPAGFGLAGLLVLAAATVSLQLVGRQLDRLDLVAVLKSKE